MCGITAIYNKSELSSGVLRRANMIVAHRGPDDEGYLLWRSGEPAQVLSGNDTAEETQIFFRYPYLSDDRKDWSVGLGHRRLSIIDLSPGGHQPMLHSPNQLAITFNGEVYNYIEIREELTKLGHQFKTDSDTEVILHSWLQWGREALHRFNGMFSFILFDASNRKLYAVRDRFGVKPLYYADTQNYVAFGSEVKQLRILPDYSFALNDKIVYDFLRYSLLDHDDETFDVDIHQVPPGHLIELDTTTGGWSKIKWYNLKPVVWKGNEKEASTHFFELLKDSVRLRMRCDVPVGSALSGGLDSSTIVCLMRKVLDDQGHAKHSIRTITSCSEDKKYDEWDYASEVIKLIKAEPHQVFPSFEKMLTDLDRMIWHMDYPFGSTSQFSQWCVFEEAKKQGLTVMIDGQGADEQLAGYGGNDMAFYAGLLGAGKISQGRREAISYKQRSGRWPIGFLLGATQINYPGLTSLFPKRYRPLNQAQVFPTWLKRADFKTDNFIPNSLRANLLRQVQVFPLPSLLRYEDRNSMAFSIESRVPFMDYRLMEFTLGLPEEFVYRKGERKHILRKTFRGLVPDKILDRTDKMGFVSAEERWIRAEGKEWFTQNILESLEKTLRFIEPGEMMLHLKRIQDDLMPFNFDPWRVLCLGLWLKQMNGNRNK